jgi:hypothetical protein
VPGQRSRQMCELPADVVRLLVPPHRQKCSLHRTRQLPAQESSLRTCSIMCCRRRGPQPAATPCCRHL